MSWPALKSHLTALLGSEHHAAIFLGTILAYPLHQLLRDHFAMVPAAWIISPSSSSNRSDRSVPSAGSDRSLQNLLHLVHTLYHPDAADPTFHFADTTTTQAIIARHAAYPHCPWHMTFRRSVTPTFSSFIENACDMGVITRGVYGTRSFAVDRAGPPLITSTTPPTDPDLTARFLNFRTASLQARPSFIHSSSSKDQTDPTSPPDQTDLCLILPALLANRKWSTKTLRLAHNFERELATAIPVSPSPTHPLPPSSSTLRRRIQLAIAAATFTAADQLLSRESGIPACSPSSERSDRSVPSAGSDKSLPPLLTFLMENPTAFSHA